MEAQPSTFEIMKWSKSGGFTIVITLSLVIFLLGLLGVLLLNAVKLNNYIKDNVQLSVFFNTDLSDSEAQRISDSLLNLKFIDGGKYVSAEEAIFNFKNEIGEDFTELLGDNPLPSSVQLQLVRVTELNQSLTALVEELEAMPEVLEISYPKDIFYQIDQNRKAIGVWLGILSIVMFGIAVVLINNTIRLLVFADRFTIKTQQLIGATERFILKPYKRISMVWTVMGFMLGSAGLCLLIWALLFWLKTAVDINLLVVRQHFNQNWHQYGIMLFLLLLSTLLIVYLITYRATKKYLNTHTDNLYG
jgi:cell division transport system permease protein